MKLMVPKSQQKSHEFPNEWRESVEINRLQSPNDKMYDDDVFAGRFRYQLVMFEMRILIILSRILHGHIACEIVIPKITTVKLHDVLNDLGCMTVCTR